MKLPLVSVVVPVRNGRHFVKDCLESLLNQDYPKEHYEILVVDNGSTDGTPQEVHRYPVTFLSRPTPLGCASARNSGIERAKGELFAFTDIDCIADQHWLYHLVEGWENSSFGGFVGRNEPAPAKNFVERQMAQFYNQETNLREKPWPFAQTNNVAYRRELFEAIGGFDESLRWWEDVEFGWRMQRKTSYQYRWNPRALIYHRNRTNLGQVAEKFFSRGYGRASLVKRTRSAYQPAIPWLITRHGLLACMQVGKLGIRAITAPVLRSGREALLPTAFWMTFHGATAVGLGVGAVDHRNRQAVIPKVNGRTLQ